MSPIVIDVTIAWSAHLYVSVTLVHPAKAVVRNEMPFDKDTHMVSSNMVLDKDPCTLREG